MRPKKKQKLDVKEEYISSYTSDEFLRIQLDELHAGIKHTSKAETTAAYINQITELLKTLKSSKKQSIQDAYESHQGKKTKWPLLETFILPNGSFKFLPPEQVLIVGGAASDTHLKTSSETDLMMVLPEETYESKDYLNGRYIVKRALYLMHIIPKLKKLDFVSMIRFKLLNNDVLKPIISIKIKSGHFINLIPSLKEGIFKKSLLGNDKNNLRPQKLFNDPVDGTEYPTPFYNHTLLSDIPSQKLSEFYDVISKSEGLKTSLVILKFWCQRKNLYEDFNGHILTYILFHLHATAVIKSEMDTLTILKQAWSFLSSKVTSSTGIILGKPEEIPVSPGIFTETGANIFYNINPSSITELSSYSKIMVDAFRSSNHEMFLSLLTNEYKSPFDLYDVVFTAQIPSVSHQHYMLQYCGVGFLGFIDHINTKLKQAYTDRITHMKIYTSLNSVWSRTKSPSFPSCITIALNVDKNTWTRQVDKGPSADAPESKSFKEFWGDKSAIRRFQDGSIIQAVVWNGKTVQERRTILTQITKHTLSKHLGIAPDNVQQFQFISSDLVGRPYYHGDGEEQAQKIKQTFSDVSKILRNCSKIPLSITSVHGVSPTLRNTELYPQQEYKVKRSRKAAVPEANRNCPPIINVHEMICHFELSGKWPEDVRGIIRLKTAFYLALKEELASLHILAKVSPDFIDIVRNGFVFRLRFFVPKESKLRSTNISFWTPCSGAGLKLQTEIMPYVSSLLSSFSIQYNAFPLTVRYLKHWVASHNMSNYIPDIFCELVVSHVFMKDSLVPQTAIAGFFRTLAFLSSFDWNLYPLINNFNDELSEEKYEELKSFMNVRKSYPDACIVCPHNEMSEITAHSPTSSSLNILQTLSKQSLVQCQNNIKTQQLQFDSIFIPDTSVFNVVIHIKPSQTGTQDVSEPTEHHAKSSHFPVVDYEPVRYYLDELTQAYGYLCLFFYNKYKPDYIGVVMKKNETSDMKFTVNNSMGKIPTTDGKMKHNLDAMVSDFDLMGKGLVKNIEVIKLDI